MGEVKVDFDMPCRGCGYNLRGLDLGGSCPECGREAMASVRGYVEESDVVAEQRRRLSAQSLGFLKWVVAGGLFAMLSYGVTAVTILMQVGGIDLNEQRGWTPWLALLGSVAGASAIGSAVMADRISSRTSRSARVWMWVSVVVSASFPVVFLLLSGERGIGRNSGDSVAIGGLIAMTTVGVVLRWVIVGSWLRSWHWRRLGWAVLVVAVMLGMIGAIMTTLGAEAVALSMFGQNPKVNVLAVPFGTGLGTGWVGPTIKMSMTLRNPDLVLGLGGLILILTMISADVVAGVTAASELRRRRAANGGTDVQ